MKEFANFLTLNPCYS